MLNLFSFALFHKMLPIALSERVWHDIRAILQAQAEAKTTFDSILERQALVDKARQDQQLAARFKSALGFRSRLHALCESRQYAHILPAYQQATLMVQSQILAVPDSFVDWGVLQTLMNQVSLAANPAALFFLQTTLTAFASASSIALFAFWSVQFVIPTMPHYDMSG